MKAVRSADTKPELVVRRLLFSAGFRYRLHERKLPGTPDLVLRRWNTVIFVNGCFWHGHKDCPHAARPAANRNFWDAKLDRNKARDREVRLALLNAGWRVLIVWECACQVRTQSELRQKMEEFLFNGSPCAEIGRNWSRGGLRCQAVEEAPSSPSSFRSEDAGQV